jgi:hypothetical protein
VRDAGWLALAVYVLLLDRRPVGVDWFWPRRRQDESGIIHANEERS